MGDRDVKVCSICMRLCSGIRLSKMFACDECMEQMLPETVLEINEVWES